MEFLVGAVIGAIVMIVIGVALYINFATKSAWR
jgi:hypothetical protein